MHWCLQPSSAVGEPQEDARVGQAELVPSAARPVRFQEGLKDMEVLEGGAATLCCKLSSVAVPVEWRREDEVLRPGDKYSMRQRGPTRELVVQDLQPHDSGQYSCHFGDQITSATLTVKGKMALPCLSSPVDPFSSPVGG